MGGFVQGSSGRILPTGAVQLNGASGNVANATATATLAPASGRTAWLTGFELTGTGATGASVIQDTVTGVLGGTMVYDVVIPASTAQQVALIVEFSMPLQASVAGGNIVVSSPAFGAGNTNASVNAHGFYQ